MTHEHVYRGLAGIFIFKPRVDPLPPDLIDTPLVISGRRLDAAYRIARDVAMDYVFGREGDVLLVNGGLRPVLGTRLARRIACGCAMRRTPAACASLSIRMTLHEDEARGVFSAWHEHGREPPRLGDASTVWRGSLFLYLVSGRLTLVKRRNIDLTILVPMSQVSCPRPHTAAFRLLLMCMLVASVAFAPVAQAVCAIERLASVITDDNGTIHDNGDSGTPTDDRDACCDTGATAMTADTDRTADMLAAHAAVFLAAMPEPHFPMLPKAWARRRAAQYESPPPEPVLLRLPRLLI